MNFEKLSILAHNILNGFNVTTLGNVKKSWKTEFKKFSRFLTTGNPVYSVFVKGNSKLPFWS